MASREYERFLKELPIKPITSELSIDEIRSRFDTWLMQFPPAQEVQFNSLQIGDLSALWTFAPEVTKRRILLFFHGGGYVAGSIEAHKNLMGRLSASASAAVLAIQYRKAPESPFPAALDDALNAYRWLLHHPYARSRIIFTGISAGAGLALSLALKLKKEQIAMPAGIIALCPWVDLAMKSKTIQSNEGKDLLKPQMLAWSAAHYASGKPLTDPLLSPLYGNFEGIPPIFIQTGSRDLLHEEAVLLAKQLKQQQVETTLDVWPDMVHSWQLFAPSFPESQEAIDRAGQFVDTLFPPK